MVLEEYLRVTRDLCVDETSVSTPSKLFIQGMSEQQPWGRKVLVITDRLVASCSSLVFHVVAEILELTGPELVEGSSHGRLLEELLKRLGSGLLPSGRSFPFVAR